MRYFNFTFVVSVPWARLVAGITGLALSCCVSSNAFAVVWTAAEITSLYGTLDQHSLQYSYPGLGIGNGSMACGPASTTNSLLFLQNAFPTVYGSSLVTLAGHDMDNSGTYTSYDDSIYTAGGILASPAFMNTTLANGTWHDNFIWGAHQYIESKVPGKTIYSAVDHWSPTYWGNSPATSPPPSWVQSGYPTWNYLYGGLQSDADEQVLFSYVGGGGHIVSVTSLTWNDQTNSGTIGFMNPWTGALGSTNIRLNGSVIYSDYGGVNGSYIGEAAVFSAVPEPGTLLLLAVGAISVLIHAWRRRATA